MNENELIVLAQAGDKEAFSTLLDGYYDKIYYRATYWNKKRDNALDATQESMWRAWKYLKSYKVVKGEFTPWLMTVVKRSSLRIAEKERWRLRIKTIEYVDFNAPYWREVEVINAGSYYNYDYVLLCQDILDCISGMPEPNRTIMAMFLDGYSYKEIMAVTNKTHASVMSHIRRGKLLLRKALA